MMTFRFLNCFFFYLSYSYFYEQQYFYGHKMQRILMENIMQNTKKNKKSLGNFILKKLRSYFLHDLLFFWVLGMGKRAFKFMGSSHLR